MLIDFLFVYLKFKYKTDKIYILQHPKYNPDCFVVLINNLILGFYSWNIIELIKGYIKYDNNNNSRSSLY